MGAITDSVPHFRLDASTITGLSDGDTVSSWTDDTGNGAITNQTTLANRPLYKTNVTPAGKPVVRFDGVDDYMLTNHLIHGVDQTIIAVVKRAATGAAHTLRGSNGTFGVMARINASDKIEMLPRSGTTFGSSTTSVNASAFHILVGTMSMGLAYQEAWCNPAASAQNTSSQAALDGSSATYLEISGTPSTGAPRTLTVRPRTSTVATSYTLTPRSAQSTRAPKDFKLQGSMDNVSWTDIDTQTGITSWSGTTPITFSSFSNSTAYTYYRLLITAVNGGTALNLAEFQINSLAPTTGSYGFNLDGTADGSGSQSVQTTYPRQGFIGVETGSTNPLNGDLAEFITWNRVLTGTEIADIVAELRGKWLTTPQSFTGAGAGLLLSASPGSFLTSSPSGQSFTGGKTGLILAAPLGAFTAGTKIPQAYSGTPTGLVIAAGRGDFVAAGTPVPQTFTGRASGLVLAAPKGRFSDGSNHFTAEATVLILGAPAGSYTIVNEHLTAGSTTEASGAAETPLDGTDAVTANSSTTTASGHAETPSDSERVIAGSTTVTAGHAAVALNVAIDPVTLRPQYRIIVVDSFGVPLGELQNAVFGDRVQTLGARGGFTFTLPKDDPKVTLLPQYAQVQLWIGAEMLPEAWFYIVDPGKDSGDVWTYQCSGIRWLLENVRIGKERPELLLNGGFEEGIKHWHPVWFAGSAAEAPPDVEIVTGAAALDGGKALQTTAVEKVIVKEIKTAAIFYGNRPYSSEPLSAGFLPGGEQVIRDAVKDFAKGIAITVEGYTADVDGGTGMALSQRRADAAKAVINAYRPDLSVTAIGRGETVQVAPNNTPENQAKNRRIVITGGSTRIGHRQAVNQWFSYTNNDRVAVELELDGWINLIDYVGPSKDRYGLYINRRNHTDASKVEDVQHTDLPPTFPKERWTPDGTSILAPADGLSHWYEVRLYGAAGDSKFDEISCKPNLYTRFYNVDRPTLIKGLVEHAQSPTFGKVSLNLETRCPAFGAKDDYEYAWKDHRTVDDAIDEVLRADDAPDFWVATTETRRIATTASRRGRYTGIVLELGGIVTDYTSAVAGDEVATTAIVTSNRDGGGAAEAFVRGAPLNGLVLERLQAAEPNRQVSRLKAMGRAMLRYGRTDVVTSVTCDPEWTVYLLGHVGPGDVCSVRIDDGSLDADGDYRIVEVQHSIARHQLTFQLVPEV